MKKIKWMPVSGYEGYYEVSSTGIVRSVGRVQQFTRKPSKYSGHNSEIESLYKKGYGSYKIGKILSDLYGYNHDSVRSYCSKFIRNGCEEILSVSRGMKSKTLSPNDNSNGYKFVNLSVDNNIKQKYIHRIVVEAFIGEIPDGFHVNHIDKNRGNNKLDNLEILCPSSNSAHANIGNGSSKYPAVSWNSSRKKWIGMFKYKNKSIYCGGFDTEEDAFKAVKLKAKEIGKELGKYYELSILI